MATYLQGVAKLPERKVHLYYISGHSDALMMDYYRRLLRTLPAYQKILVDFALTKKRDAEVLLFTERTNEPVVFVLKSVSNTDLPLVREVRARIDPRDYVIVIHPGNPRDSADASIFRDFASAGRFVECNPFTEIGFGNFLSSELAITDEQASALLEHLAYETDEVLYAVRLLQYIGIDNLDLIPRATAKIFTTQLLENHVALLTVGLTQDQIRFGIRRTIKQLFLGHLVSQYNGDYKAASNALDVPIFTMFDAYALFKAIDPRRFRFLVEQVLVLERFSYPVGSLHTFIALWSDVRVVTSNVKRESRPVRRTR